MADWAKEFARDWQDAWNAHDLPRVLSHYADDVQFRSPKAIALTGTGIVQGKTALRAYWAAALDQQPDLHFVIEHVYAGHDMVVITYTNHRGIKTCETLVLNDEGRVQFGAACHLVN